MRFPDMISVARSLRVVSQCFTDGYVIKIHVYTQGDEANGKMRACGDAGLQFRVRVSVRDRVGVRVSDGVMVSTFLARDVIYTSRSYAMMPVRLSVCLPVCL